MVASSDLRMLAQDKLIDPTSVTHMFKVRLLLKGLTADNTNLKATELT